MIESVISQSSQADGASESWRDHWLVKILLIDIPIFGSFFRIRSRSESIYHIGKDIFSLAGGVTAPALFMVFYHKEESLAIKITQMSSSMVAGMYGGKVLYNSLATCAKSALYYYNLRNENTDLNVASDASSGHEKQPLLVNERRGNRVLIN